jgi:uncharacterized protein involved in response to NO
VHTGAIARVGAAFAPGDLQRSLLVVAGLLWAAAFALFAVLYAPILVRPRVDGEEG